MTHRARKPGLRTILAVATAAGALAGAARADVFSFDQDPFAGTTVLTTAGRQVVQNGFQGGVFELTIPDFDLANDRIRIDSRVFGVDRPLTGFVGFAADLPDQAFDFIVLRNLDGDPNTAGNQMNAGLAANLIADRLSTSAPGFFFYFNSFLNLPRLVYSTDLGSPTADLRVLARFQNLGGQAGIDALAAGGPHLTAGVPEPAAWALMIAGFGLLGGAVRRRRALAVAL
jgi:hypothetical protein